MTRVLLVGYGRAGRRLAAAMDALGLDWIPVDPVLESRDITGRLQGIDYYLTLETSLAHEAWEVDFAIIASPPALHLSQIRQCLDAGLPVLCEKPLCSWGQLPDAETLLSHPMADKIGMTFNYRWHPAVMRLKDTWLEWKDRPGVWEGHSEQYRAVLPEWGMVLDHLPHTIDLFLYLSGAKTMTVTDALFFKSPKSESAGAIGRIDRRVWKLADVVAFSDRVKEGWLAGPMGKTVIETSAEVVKAMTEGMLKDWLAFLEGKKNYSAGLRDGIRVQRVMEEINAKMVKK